MIEPALLAVPVFAAIAQVASRRGVSAGRITAASCLLCALGVTLVLLSVGEAPTCVTAVLPGWIVSGAGVGLAMPTILSTATVDLPSDRSATGSAIVNMARQAGAVLGVSLLVALVGAAKAAHEFAETRGAFQRLWVGVALAFVAASVSARGMRPAAETAWG